MPGFGRTTLRAIERVMPVMTQVNVGAAPGMVGWILWSGPLVAVTLLCGAAVAAGGGFASPQVPPDSPNSPNSQNSPARQAITVQALTSQPSTQPSADRPALTVRVSIDTAPPWTVDREGRVRLTER
jgi:hypothetical protein